MGELTNNPHLNFNILINSAKFF